MNRTYALASLILLLTSAASIAAPVGINGLNGNYTPGDSLSFEVSLPAIANIGSYNIDLVLTGSTGMAGTDFFFDVAATDAASSNYIFASTANYFDAVNIDSPLVHRLTLSDLDLSGVDVVAGINDQVATVVIGTSASFLGDLSLVVDSAGLILDTPDATPTPVQGFDAIVSDTDAAGDTTLVPVPEPTSGLLLVLMSSIAMAWRKRSTAI